MFRCFGFFSLFSLFFLIFTVSWSQDKDKSIKKKEASVNENLEKEKKTENLKEGKSSEKEEVSKEKKISEEERRANQISTIQEYLKPMIYNRETRDPFERPASPLKMGQIYGPFLELQNYNLENFNLKGLIWETSNPRAIFQGPDNKEYRLAIKDYIGENFGYIAAIREREVVVIQTIEENNKRYSTTKVVFLKKQKER